ncbi:MAG TPA: hypothetical protein PLU22_26860 [Polyangiaceae bacterium]|nr:hypothetical protein [Polyangiaceae bacterium]
MVARRGWGRLVAAALAVGCAGPRVAAHVPVDGGGVGAPSTDLPPGAAPAGPAGRSARQVPPGWVGGTAEAEVARGCDAVTEALLDPDAYWALFANTRAVEPRGIGSRGELLVTLEQGYAFASGRYVAHVLEVNPRRVVAWIDPIRNVRDGWAEFDLDPIDAERCHVAMFTAADLGEGVVVRLFRNAIEGAMLMTPELLRDFVEQG